MPKKKVVDPRVRFQEGIERIRRDFLRFFNSNVDRAAWQKNMEGLFWEDAVFALAKTNRTIQGQRPIAKFWWDFKHKKPGRKLKRLSYRFQAPSKFPVYLIGVVSKEMYNLYDIGAYDFFTLNFSPDGAEMLAECGYLHKRTCTTAIYEMTIEGV